jgi:integron integrase
MGDDNGAALSPEVENGYLKLLEGPVGIPANRRSFFVKWLGDFLGFCRSHTMRDSDPQALAHFLDGLIRRGRPGFQVDQARLAVHVFWRHFRPSAIESEGKGIRNGSRPVADSSPTRGPLGPAPEGPKAESDLPQDWLHAIGKLVQEIRLRHYSGKTLRAYRHWISHFALETSAVPVGTLTGRHAKEFLTRLADGSVAGASQNQAFSALRFFYLNVLKADFNGLEDTPRAPKRHDVPVVLTRGEVTALLAALEYPYRLCARLLYGCGMRLNETLTLRVQDLDLGMGLVRPHNGKGNRSRSLPLPRTLIPELESHLASVRNLFDSDLKVGFAGVFLPDSLQRKLSAAGREWQWQWVFPAGRLTLSRQDGRPRRFHLHETGIQKEIRAAAERIGLGKRVTPHTLRHSYATHLLQMGYDIRTVQDLLGHREVATTMIYTHALQSTQGKVLSPLDL